MTARGGGASAPGRAGGPLATRSGAADWGGLGARFVRTQPRVPLPFRPTAHDFIVIWVRKKAVLAWWWSACNDAEHCSLHPQWFHRSGAIPTSWEVPNPRREGREPEGRHSSCRSGLQTEVGGAREDGRWAHAKIEL